MNSFNSVVGQRIKKQLDKIGWTQVDLAKELNISRQIVNKIIHGRKNITLEEIKMIGDILEVSLEDLVKQNNEEIEENPIIAFMGEVNSEAAKNGLKKAKKVMDLILFHRDLNEAHQDLFVE
ncbi:MAG: helix-turn-helix transcriptional regulator [Halanaerobiales bacterium]|nr:helix-turn-helix transcriptional regulator [Halanaerobiales bacterium]